MALSRDILDSPLHTLAKELKAAVDKILEEAEDSRLIVQSFRRGTVDILNLPSLRFFHQDEKITEAAKVCIEKAKR